MLRTIGYAFAVLAVGSVAIAWTNGPGPQTALEATTLTPERLQVNIASLPNQEFVDRTFVYANEH